MMAFAQEKLDSLTIDNTSVVNEISDHRYEYHALSSAKSNWYIDLGVGSQMLFSKDANNLTFGNRQSLALNLNVGKWFSPYFGARAQFSGYQLNGYSTAKGIYLGDPISANTVFGNSDPIRDYMSINPNGGYRHYVRYANVHVDAMFNIIPFFKDDSKWSVVPAMGFGYMVVFKYKGMPTAHVMTSHASVMGKYQINEYFDVNMELQSMFMPDAFDGRIMGRKLENNLGLTIGATYRFGKRNFKKCESTYTSASVPVPVPVPQLKEEPVVDTVYVEKVKYVVDTVAPEGTCNFSNFAVASILFPFDSKVAIKNQDIQFDNIAKLLNGKKSLKVLLEAYSDEEIGTAEYNKHLSEQRAKYVFERLVKDYGVAEEQLEIKAYGVEKRPYADKSNNRVVIAVVK